MELQHLPYLPVLATTEQSVVLDTVKQELKALLERNNAVVTLPHVNTRWDTDVEGWGYSPWFYCGGDNRVFHVQPEKALVRFETSNDPSFLTPFSFYRPTKESAVVSTKEAMLFVRLHCEALEDNARVRVGISCR